MRIAFIGVSHWHAPLFYRPAARLAGVQIVGVSDDDADLAERVGRGLGARSFADYRELLDGLRPDFAFAFGRHCDMPAVATALIERAVPFIIEKPAGLDASTVAGLRDRAREKNLHAGTGFNWRASDLLARLREVIGDEPVTQASFRYIGGGPHRYHELGCSWMLDPALSGGGSTINLSVHFFDLFRLLSGSEPSEVSALMGRQTWGLPIEDYSAVLLRSERCTGAVETGYTYPAPTVLFDQRFSLRTRRHYLVVRNDDVVEVHHAEDGRRQEFSTWTANLLWYPKFVADSLDRFARGLPPLASLDDLVAAMQVVDAAYASDRAGGATIRLPG
jgi:predicted dehydrogenase